MKYGLETTACQETKLGNTVNRDASEFTLFSWNYVDLNGNDANLIAGTDYYIVVYFTAGSETGILIDDGNVDSRNIKEILMMV